MTVAAHKLDFLTDPEQLDHPLTLLELVAAVAEQAESDGEILSVVADLINSGKVKLVGNFRGADVKVG